MKKLLVLLLTMIMLVMGAVFISCDEVVNFKVSFVVDDAVYSTIDTSGNEVIKMPENPTKEGYTFEGWYWDKDVWNKPFTANSLLDTPLSSDMNVYAKWEHIHTPSDWIEDTPADYGVAGSKHKECTVCKVVLETEVIPALLQGTDIMSEALTVNGETAYVSLSNATGTFSFLNDITVADGASYVVARDIGCEQTIASKTVSLNIGDNVYYILVTNGNAQKLYTVTVRRRPMFTVTFNTAGGSSVPSQTIEEGYYLTAPKETTRAGYTFSGWNADLTAPITANKTITAQWTAHTNTPYKVEYYKENVDKNGYDLVDTQNLTGTTDTRANAEQKTFEHFTLNTSKSTLSGNINGSGTLVLKVYYRRNSYTVSLDRNNTSAGTVSGGGTYGYDKQVTVTATTNSGYNWLGWFDGNTLVSENATYTFKADKSINLTAKWDYYTVTTGTNMSVAGTYTQYSGTKVSAGTEITLTATPKTGYTFLGWYNGETLVSENATYTFTMGKANVNLTAKWDYYTVTTSTNISTAGTYTQYSGTKISAGTQVTLTATPKLGYNFIGWFDGDKLITENTSYSFTMPRKNLTFVPKFVIAPEMQIFNFTSTENTCNITSLKDESATTVVIPDYVTSIGDRAFQDCDSLTSVTIGNGVESIGIYAFYDCSSLTSVNITDIAKWCAIEFGGYYSNPLYYAENLYLNGTLVTELVILDSVTNIGDYAFSNCTSLTSITIPNSVTSIGNYAFTYCTSLTSVTIPDSVTSIGDYAFYDCDSLTSVTIPNSVTSIGDYAFWLCSALTSVTIGNSVTSIGYKAFSACFSLTNITVDENNTAYKSIDGNLYTKDGKTLIQYSIGKTTENFVIPDSVTSIGNYAFSWCHSLTSVTIPDSVTSIGDSAFYDCDSLTSVTIGNGVTSIGNYAFSSCSKLTSVKYRGTEQQWKNISKSSIGYSGTITYNYTGE